MVVLSTCLLLGDQPVLIVYSDHLLELMIILVALHGLWLPGLPMEIISDAHSSQKSGKEPKESFPISEVVAATKSESVDEPAIPDNRCEIRMPFCFKALRKEHFVFTDRIFARIKISNGEQDNR